MGGDAGSEKPANGDGQGRNATSASSNDQHRKTEPDSRGTPGSKEKPADGEAKREDHGGVLRADAKWVVLLGALSAAVTLLAYVGIQGSTLVHVFSRTAASSPAPRPRSSPSPDPGATQPTQPVPTLSASLLPVFSSSSSTLPSPTQDSSSPALAPSDLDNAATDPTDVSVATMLPQQYDDSGTVFNLTSASAEPCPPVSTGAVASVNNALQNYGCASEGEIVGTYLDSSQQIQVAVWVIPLPDTADADGAYDALTTSAARSSWGIWCPVTGTGSQVCQGSWQDATQSAWIGACHRYLVRAVALYVDLASDSTLMTVLNSAGDAATMATGPRNIPGAEC